MCTSIVANKKKTIIGWNLDILDMEYKVVAEQNRVTIAILDQTEGWLPLFGANARGDFVGMPTCWPFDNRSDAASPGCRNILMLDIDLLLEKKTFAEVRRIAETQAICSVPGVTFQAQLSDKEGNVLRIVPGQGYQYLPKPPYAVMTNFSPFKGESEQHPWMGWDRYTTADELLRNAGDDFDVADCFELLKKNAQTACPTVVSMVFDVTENVVYWCEKMQWDKIEKQKIG